MDLYELIWRYNWEDKPATLEKAYLLAPDWPTVISDTVRDELEWGWAELVSITLLDRNINSAKSE